METKEDRQEEEEEAVNMVIIHGDGSVSPKKDVDRATKLRKKRKKKIANAQDALEYSSLVDVLHEEYYDSEEPGAYVPQGNLRRVATKPQKEHERKPPRCIDDEDYKGYV